GLSSDALAHAVREALTIHDGLQAGVATRLTEGVSIVAVGVTDDPEIESPICKVCGEPIVTPGVLCVACRTPHHRDCWEFVGSCSIYGCTGKHSVPA
ncbi:RING finger protein, partial [Singulisphaera rosea]